MDQFVLEQKSEGVRSNVLAVILAIAAIALIGVGSTFAYMHWGGNQTPNRFTTDKGLTVDLVEPDWTKTVSETTGGYPNVASDGTTTIPAAANNLSKTTATSGGKVKKNPYVVNTSMVGNETDQPGSDAYVGIRLTLQKWVASSTEGIGDAHRETGHYVTLTNTEAELFWKCFSINQDGNTTKSADATTKYGVTLATGSQWAQYKSDGTAGVEYKAQSYFIYKKGIKSVGEAISGNYPNAGTGLATDVATSELFHYVQLVNDGDPLSDFINALKADADDGSVNATTDPGWRILVDTAAVDCTDITKDITTDSDSTNRIAALVDNDTYPEVNTTGASPSVNKYWVEGSGTSSGKSQGTGYGVNAANVPETHWDY